MIDPNAGKRTYIPIKKISPYVIAATTATEDKEYYNHAGFDPLAITRALWQNYTTGEVISGASTITQQLARSFLLSSTERNEKTVQRKAKEIVLAALHPAWPGSVLSAFLVGSSGNLRCSVRELVDHLSQRNLLKAAASGQGSEVSQNPVETGASLFEQHSLPLRSIGA